MGCVDDPREGARAAAAINTVQLICGAFGAGLAGVVVNPTDRGDATAGTLACSPRSRCSQPLDVPCDRVLTGAKPSAAMKDVSPSD